MVHSFPTRRSSDLSSSGRPSLVCRRVRWREASDAQRHRREVGDDEPPRMDHDGCSRTRWHTGTMEVETSNPNGLMRLGWSKRSLKPGDQITVDAFRAKDGSNTANAARITLADGR